MDLFRFGALYDYPCFLLFLKIHRAQRFIKTNNEVIRPELSSRQTFAFAYIWDRSSISQAPFNSIGWTVRFCDITFEQTCMLSSLELDCEIVNILARSKYGTSIKIKLRTKWSTWKKYKSLAGSSKKEKK